LIVGIVEADNFNSGLVGVDKSDANILSVGERFLIDDRIQCGINTKDVDENFRFDLDLVQHLGRVERLDSSNILGSKSKS
jgi:hypothetical protein